MRKTPFKIPSKALFLAPMQDVTDLRFMQAVNAISSPDFYCAEYFRIHESFELDRRTMEAVNSQVLSAPVVAQFIGGDESDIAKAALELSKRAPRLLYLDLNIGCPVAKIYRKNAGGGLLRFPEKIKRIVRVLRDNWEGVLSVKMRAGFAEFSEFEHLFESVMETPPDYITIHARTVAQLYRGKPDYSIIKRGVELSGGVPVVANGDISSARKAVEVFNETGCAGVMIGRPAVRNPWIFRQIREFLNGEEVFNPLLSDVRAYVQNLADNILCGGGKILHADSRLKKYLNFVALGVDPEGKFLREMRLARGMDSLLRVCDKHLLDNGSAEKKFSLDAYEGICARPNCEL